PGMILEEDRQYYSYIGKFYSGVGQVVELGCWLSRSTHYILKGLLPNPHFQGRKLYVHDGFVWQSWMDPWYNGHDRPAAGDSFLPLFERFTAHLREQLIVRQRSNLPDEGYEHLPPLTWDEGPVEMLFVDCGPYFTVNQAWYEVFWPHLLPNKTLILLK